LTGGLRSRRFTAFPSSGDSTIMATKCRLFMAVAAGSVLLAAWALLSTTPAEGQVKRPVQPPPPPAPPVVIGRPVVDGFPGMPGQPTAPADRSGPQFSALRLAEKSEYRNYINVARDCIKDKAWSDACTALQTILDQKNDFYVQLTETDPKTKRETKRRTSAKYEANSLLSSMPDEGLDVYEQRFGGKARKLLDEAKKKGDFEAIGDVAARYLHTQAGAEANELLATHYLDRGQFFMAALRFERQLALNPKRFPVSDLTLFKAIFAYRRAGDVKSAERLWKELEPRLEQAGGLKIGEKLVNTEQLEQALAKISRPELAGAHDWPMVGGNVTHSAQALGSAPLLDQVRYRWPLAPGKEEPGGDSDSEWVNAAAAVKRQLDTTLERAHRDGAPIIPGFFPIAVGGRVVFRTYFGISAFTVREIMEADGTVYKPGELYWRNDFDCSLGNLLNPRTRDSTISSTINTWLSQFGSGYSELLYENSMVGTLTTDHRLVFAVDDLAVPPPRHLMMPMQPWIAPGNRLPPAVEHLAKGNTLKAYDLVTGKLIWEQGRTSKYQDFKDGLFLGPPLPVGGKLYALFEHNSGDLELVTLNPQDGTLLGPPQQLGTVEDHAKAIYDLSRRIHAVHLAYGEGFLVVPTNAGEVLGVDLLSRTLAWAYPYREKSSGQGSMIGGMPGMPGVVVGGPPGFPGAIPLSNQVVGNWYNTPPIIVEGKVVFTAPDANSVHCINLRDGVQVWKRPQADGDLYLGGVYDGKVVIVAKTGVRLLRLSTGEQLKFLPTGDMPSGQGVASKNVYYLPLSKGEICAIDLEHETIKAHNRAVSKGPPPGNLLFYEGDVFSATPREVIAYPQLAYHLELADKAVAEHPDDLLKREERGELLLADGQVQKAVDDLRLVLNKDNAGKLPEEVKAKARQKLYLAMSDLFQANFNEASVKYLEEYRELCKVPGNPQEEQQRQAHFLRLLGQGREAQGDLVAAFQAYKDFGALPIHRDGVIRLPEDPSHKIPVSSWLRGRVSAMLAKATPQQRRPLEEKIAQEWKAVQAKGDIDSIRSFVGMFDVSFAVGREARLRLAEAIIEKDDKSAFLEAELNLEQLRSETLKDDPDLGGRALEMLTRLEMRKNTAESMRQAVAYLRRLAVEFPKAKLPGGKTGADLVNEKLGADKRFLPYLDDGGPLWPGALIKARELNQATTTDLVNRLGLLRGVGGSLALKPRGDSDSPARGCRLLLNISSITDPQVSLVDVVSAKRLYWTERLGPLDGYALMNWQWLYNQAGNNAAFYPKAGFRYFEARGHLAVFQVGTMAFGIDLETGKKLWQHSLLESPIPQGTQVQQVMPDADGRVSLMLWNPQLGGQLRRLRVGQIVAVQPSYVALLLQKTLVVLDPLQGAPLWTLTDLPADTTVFGDDQYLYLVDTAGGGSNGRALRASDGAPVKVDDFGGLYKDRVRIVGSRILAAVPEGKGLTLRLYDIPTGKDVWAKTFDAKATVLWTEDPHLTGAIEPDGKVSILDARSGEELAQANALQFRVTKDDLNNLEAPLLLADRDHFYLALNHPLDPQKVQGVVMDNFSNGVRCAPVNGWVLAFHRKAGQGIVNGEVVRWKKGDFHWHTYKPMHHQMIVLEQFERLPVLIFSSRYMEPMKNPFGGAMRWISMTESVDKRTGKMIYAPDDPRPTNGSPQFYAFAIDPKDATINLIGWSGTVQHYVDDGRKRPELEGRLSPEQGGNPYATGVIPPGVGIRPIIRPRPPRIIRVPPPAAK
jgi:outer membrane protein assembly factor BamB/tetratricopeptide (TPR) repeat protein